MMALGGVFHEHNHMSAWDGETLSLLVGTIGFDCAVEVAGGTSRIVPAPDSPVRILQAVHVQVVVPT